MSTIHRDIYLTRHQRIQPIDIVRGSQVGIELQLMDYDIPVGASANAYARGRYAPDTYVANCAVSGKTVAFVPPDGFFIPGPNRLQIEINGVIIPFSIDVNCESRVSDAGDPATPEQVRPLTERAEAAASAAEKAATDAGAALEQIKTNYPEIPEMSCKIGDLNSLPTNAKNNLVAAINEVGAAIPLLNNCILTATGDSISATNGGFAKLIADQFGMEYENVAMGGGTIAHGIYNVDGSKRPCICDTIASMRADADIILLSGGVNDQVEFNHNLEAVGDLTDGFDKQLNKATFCGAMEYMLRQAVYKWSNKTILFVLPHRMTKNLDYRTAALAVCEKYGVPVVDVMESTMDFYTLPEFKELYTHDGDGWHPNTAGYQTFYIPRILDAIREHFRGRGETVSIPDEHMPDVISENIAVPVMDEYTPSIAGFVRTNGTISTSTNYLRTDYIPLTGKTDIEYNVYISGGSELSTWALFDEEKNWIASSDDVNGTDFWHIGPGNIDIMMGYKRNTLSVSNLLATYPTALYIVLSTYAAPDQEQRVDINGVNIGWGSGKAYIKLIVKTDPGPSNTNTVATVEQAKEYLGIS